MNDLRRKNSGRPRGRGGRGVWGEFRRARAFRRSEAEAVSFVQRRFEQSCIIPPIGNSTVFSMDTSGRRKAPTKDFLAGLQGNSEFLARKRASRLAKTRFEPKSFSAATFFTKRLLSCAILGKELASFIHSAIGSSQPVRFCSRRVDCSSSDFFSLNNFDFSNRYVSRSMSCSK